MHHPILNLSSSRVPRFSTYPLVAITKYGQGRLAGFMHERHISDAQMYTPLVRPGAALRPQGCSLLAGCCSRLAWVGRLLVL